MRIKTLTALAVLVASAAVSYGQSTIEYYSKLSQHGKVPAQCLMAGQDLIAGLNKFPHPAQWTYIVICDDASWNQIMEVNHTYQAKYVHGATFRAKKLTMFRGTTLRDENKMVTSDHVIAHELCHIFLDSDDEVKVENLALTWLGKIPAQQVAVK